MTDTSPLRLLFVEDNDYLRDTMAALLEDDDCEVVACASAEEAVRLWRASRFDVLVTDVSLGGMSGMDLARQVLADAPETWVVLSSGYLFDQGLDQLGPNVRSLPKPFEMAEMEALLAQVRASRG